MHPMKMMTRALTLLCLTVALLPSVSASVVAGSPQPASGSKPEGIMAPDFVLPTIANAGDADTLTLADFRGRVVYVDFWASWCGPCRLSLPALDAIYREMEEDGLMVIAVSVDVVEEDALDFLTRYPVSYPVVIDTDGSVPREFGVNGMPSGYLIDRSGQVREVHVGFRRGDEDDLRDAIAALIAE